MLPLVIGGIAAAAVGYAIKEYCEEEGCFGDDARGSSTSNRTTNEPHNNEILYATKSAFCDLVKAEYLPCIVKLEGYEYRPLKYAETDLKKESNNHEGSQVAKALLTTAVGVMEASSLTLKENLEKIKHILSDERTYDSLTEEEKSLLDSTHKLVLSTSKLCHKKMFKKDGKVSAKYVQRLEEQSKTTLEENPFAKMSQLNLPSYMH